MPKVAYSEEDRRRVREELLTTALKLMSTQGIQHTTVEQVYRSVGISRSFFYTFFPTKEDLIVEALYLQQPRLLEYARSRMEDPAISWREGVRQFLDTCCYGGRNGVAVLSVDEQQMLFQRLSEESFRTFRTRQPAALRRHSGELRHRSGAGPGGSVHQSEPGGHCAVPGDPPDPADVCARCRPGVHSLPDPLYCGLAGIPAGTAGRTALKNPIFHRRYRKTVS